jgi:hypothetical protein
MAGFSIQNLEITGNEKAILFFIIFLLFLKNPLITAIIAMVVYLYSKRKNKIEKFQNTMSSMKILENDVPFIFMDTQLLKLLLYVVKKFRINHNNRKNSTFYDLLGNLNEMCFMLYKKNRLKMQPQLKDLQRYKDLKITAYNNFHNLVYILPSYISANQFNLIQERFHNIISNQNYILPKDESYFSAPQPFNYES